MTESLFCGQCGPERETPVGVLFEKRPDYVDAAGGFVRTMWEKVGPMCQKHLKINGGAARSNGMETKIEPLSAQKVEAKS